MSSVSISPQVVLVTGPSGSGKTVLTSALVEALGVAACGRVGMDDYYADSGEIPADERPAINFDHPDAIDWDLLMEHVRTLLAGRPIEKPCYDFVTHTRLPKLETVHPLRLVVLDGIHAMSHEALVSVAGLTVYVDASRETCFARRLERDVVERGRSEVSVREQFDGSVWPMAERYILPMRDRADFVVLEGMSVGDAVGGVIERLVSLD